MLDFSIPIRSGINLKSGDRINRHEFSQNQREIDDNTTMPPYSQISAIGQDSMSDIL
ncbi:hypothetical protein [Limnofasciculus baicalensis]|uniref:Uncharacterized protein n=1 Tax=Limnofasciculus baicalensis BBK-W-15 TaxID=2699891 RepID=A0AAE3GX92_9CYAN|nr:hypothetical protein [Limnofasciculus baicalensis]MCP2732204.1 hypothetical protein [Limnofasciculus baicalensis BBK-W-15]